ncbi:hypothetical protein ASG43_17445 [Aureimonas sp. Leaf454]|nr:hypothetical protein ASG43_17445 [Aureimonas sp. Leaf454]
MSVEQPVKECMIGEVALHDDRCVEKRSRTPPSLVALPCCVSVRCVTIGQGRRARRRTTLHRQTSLSVRRQHGGGGIRADVQRRVEKVLPMVDVRSCHRIECFARQHLFACQPWLQSWEEFKEFCQ